MAQTEVFDTSRKIIKKIKSKPEVLKCGVPQGSFLGPLLLLIYINDLTANFPGIMFSLFTDDTSMVLHNKNIDLLYLDSATLMNNVLEWFKFNKLMLNPEKSCSILFQAHHGTNIQRVLLTTTGDIAPVEHTKFLGRYVDRCLKWDVHTGNLNKKLSTAIYAVNTIKQIVGFKAALTVYYSYFHSILQYGIEYWGNSATISSTFIVQERAIRTLFNLKIRDSCRQYFLDNKIFTVTNLYIYKLAIII